MRTVEEDAYMLVAMYLFGPTNITAAFATQERADAVLHRAREILTVMAPKGPRSPRRPQAPGPTGGVKPQAQGVNRPTSAHRGSGGGPGLGLLAPKRGR